LHLTLLFESSFSAFAAMQTYDKHLFDEGNAPPLDNRSHLENRDWSFRGSSTLDASISSTIPVQIASGQGEIKNGPPALDAKKGHLTA